MPKLINTASYKPGDTVWIRIDEVDRTNTDPRLVPCKVLEVQTEGHTDTLYKVYTTGGGVKTKLWSEELLDTPNVCFPVLQNVDVANLEDITLIPATRINTGWKAIYMNG